MAIKRALSVLFIGMALVLSGCSFDAQKDAPKLDLRSFERSTGPNDALACPAGVCRADADFESPTFDLSRQALLDRAAAIIAARPRTERVRTDPGLIQIVFVQRSRLFAFPDIIWIQSAGTDQRASLILYSRSRYGYWDLGVNSARIQEVLGALQPAARP